MQLHQSHILFFCQNRIPAIHCRSLLHKASLIPANLLQFQVLRQYTHFRLPDFYSCLQISEIPAPADQTNILLLKEIKVLLNRMYTFPHIHPDHCRCPACHTQLWLPENHLLPVPSMCPEFLCPLHNHINLAFLQFCLNSKCSPYRI